MSIVDLAPWIAQAGTVGVIAWVFVALHRSAVGAERRRADDWRAVAGTAQARADVATQQVATVLAAVQARAGAA